MHVKLRANACKKSVHVNADPSYVVPIDTTCIFKPLGTETTGILICTKYSSTDLDSSSPANNFSS
jgi:hypothetical protein